MSAIAVAVAACAPASAERVIRVDYRHDEFASFFWRFFPGRIEAHPGDTIAFEQRWTGEPHTVTFGTDLDALEEDLAELEKKYENQPETEEVMEEATEEYFELVEGVVFDPYNDADAPLAVRPCYLRRGAPPKDEPCARSEQPAFDGRFSYYSSGIIPPDGPRGDTYRVELADDIEPGTYSFYCVLHYPSMQGSVVVRPDEEDVPSQQELNRRTLREIEEVARPLRNAFRDARAGRAETAGERLEPPIAGYHAGDNYTDQVLEFIPRTIRTRTRKAVTWTITGAHTISFDVPRFLPIYTVEDDGDIRRNKQVDRPAGGSPKPPPPDFTQGPIELDGGTYDGDGFLSSGLIASEPYAKYTLEFSKEGRYRYACLIHPAMVGTLIVEG